MHNNVQCFPRVLEGGGTCVVVHKVSYTLFSSPHFPAEWEGHLVSHGQPRVFPLRSLALMVDKICPSIRK